MDRTVNILGTEYGIEVDENLIKTDADGICEEYKKKITVRPLPDMLTEQDDDATKLKRYNEVLRHELFHAYFSESGLDDYSANEQLVNWLAIQSPKIFKVFQELDIL